ncbi:MAG: sigma-70 family RNA polymerase sigma factor [Roseburia sp.]|nr:sigma-70 family RNA polymerase sigma factor [Anaeroplasma bactoclasticum]MCM1197163.1 sigma-70 family RNA polymerase sigma factor [Roseburia sp.]MCM1557618.1 sigma-70 family RNA polymerase sigma factor [Anaeroplasma bactoclasticum]
MTEEEFSIKYQMYSQEIFSICYGYTKNSSDAEDILQEVFLKYLNKKILFNDSLQEKYWLIRVTINACKNYVKSSYHTRVTLAQEILEAYSDKSLQKETDVLARIVTHLPKKYKDVIILYYYNSYKTNEIAGFLHISLSAVKKRLERARNMFQEEMEKYL